MAREEVYVNMMIDTLERKKVILEQILHQTKEQEILLKDEEMDMDAFQTIIDRKGEEIEKLNQMDEGFDTLFHHVEKEINENDYDIFSAPSVFHKAAAPKLYIPKETKNNLNK